MSVPRAIWEELPKAPVGVCMGLYLELQSPHALDFQFRPIIHYPRVPHATVGPGIAVQVALSAVVELKILHCFFLHTETNCSNRPSFSSKFHF